jgi:hypothetical protein
MEKSVIVEKNWDFFYADMAGFLKKTDLFDFLIEKIDRKSPIEIRLNGKSNCASLKIFYQEMQEHQKQCFIRKIMTSLNRTNLITKMWRSIEGDLDEKSIFKFNGIHYDFQVKGYCLASIDPAKNKWEPLFIPLYDLLFFDDITGREPLEAVAELKIGLADNQEQAPSP